ncbi:hypothetical protein BH10PSE6_BH10PSE6_33130 [soil metagenome]
MLCTQERARQIGGDDVRPAGQGQIDRGRHLAQDTGVVEGHVEAAEPAHRFLDERLGEGFVSDIARQCDGVPTIRFDLGDERVEFCSPSRSDDDLCAFASEELRCCVSDPGAGSGDDGDLVGENGHSVLLLMFHTDSASARYS